MRENSVIDMNLKNLKSQSELVKIDTSSSKKDLTDLLKSHKLRCEIERAFFFHVFFEILKKHFSDRDP